MELVLCRGTSGAAARARREVNLGAGAMSRPVVGTLQVVRGGGGGGEAEPSSPWGVRACREGWDATAGQGTTHGSRAPICPLPQARP